MGFRYRKSLNYKCFKVNLSKSGIGYSVGIPGYRLTQKANGRVRSTFSIPKTGLSYVNETSDNSKKNSCEDESEKKQSNIEYEAKIDSEDILNIDENEFIDKINICITRNKQYKKYIIIALIIGIFIWPSLFIALVMFIYKKKNIQDFKLNINYSFDEYYEEYYNNIKSILDEIKMSEKIWFIKSSHKVEDERYNSGASSSIDRQLINIEPKCPKYVESNIIPYSINIENKTIYFFPDRIFVETNKNIFDIKFSHIELKIYQRKFIEEEPLTKDSIVVEKTWKYINKNGTPDKRFSNNYEIPVCLYTTINCYTQEGFNIKLQLSNGNSCSILQELYKQLQSISINKNEA